MALADAYSRADRMDAQETMLQCAYKQGHGAAADALAVKRSAVDRNYQKAIEIYQDGVKFGCHGCATALNQLFNDGYWFPDQKQGLTALNITEDQQRAQRYQEIANALQINPDLKFTRLDQVLPLPPAKLPSWNGLKDALEPASTAPPTY